ncbi:MAG: autotransporter outer membrane beta-barrel domain-containing protein [Magnetococcales bacterium]|nr:autotransporter outer membrane beta-barrel domain-containing protein [Magnetococcales bacterium]
MSSKKNTLGVVAGAAFAVALTLPGLALATEWQCQGGRLLVDIGNGAGLTDLAAMDEATWNAVGTGYSFPQFVSSLNEASRLLCASTAAARTTQLRSSAGQTVGLLSQRAAGTVRSLRSSANTTAQMNGTLTGLSAGSAAGKTGVWANYDHTRTGDDVAGVDTKLNNFVLGGDYKVMSKLAVGAALSYQETDPSLASSDSVAWTVAPYAAYLINDNMSVDAVAGYTWLDTDSPLGGGYDTRRYFVASNLNAFTTDLEQWEIGGHVGFMFAKDDIDSYQGAAQNDISFLQAKTGIETAYSVTKGIQPYLNLDYEQDLVYEANPGTYDDAGFVSGLGVRFDLPSSLLGELRYGKTYGRKNFEQDALTANLRMNF